jgi:hypothetical protein
MITFERDGVDPVSRCSRCGAAVAQEGQLPHLGWHQSLTRLKRELEQAQLTIAELQDRPS